MENSCSLRLKGWFWLNRYFYKYCIVTVILSLIMGAVFYEYFSSQITQIVKTKVIHVSTPPENSNQPEAPVFGQESVQYNDRSTIIHIYHHSGSTYNACIMTVSNPTRISVVTTKYQNIEGQTVEQIVLDNHAIAGINGGSFLDPNWQGTGGQVQGIVISDGKVIVSSKHMEQIIGFTRQGKLISGDYFLSELKSMDVVQALMFGPTLVRNGAGVVQGNGDWGYAPRTAIGQRADGTVIMIVTDGRELTGGNDIGASLGDIQNLMLQYGAVTAANLDGGSSATMIYHHELVNEPTDILGQREVGTAVIVR